MLVNTVPIEQLYKEKQWQIEQAVINKKFRTDIEFRTRTKPSKKLYKRSKSNDWTNF